MATFGIVGSRSDVNTGVWIGCNKISAVGVSASRWITYHGTSVNLSCDLSNFNNIVPCGITKSGYGVCRLADLTKSVASSELMSEFEKRYVSSFATAFDITPIQGSPDELVTVLQDWPDISASSLTRIDA